MNIKRSIEVIAAAEKAGVRIVIDSTQWDGPASAYPLDPAMSPSRCDLVAEARRLADSLDRPATPPDGSVYGHSIVAIGAAVAKAAKHIEQSMKGQSDDERSEDVAEGDEQPADAGAVRGAEPSKRTRSSVGEGEG